MDEIATSLQELVQTNRQIVAQNNQILEQNEELAQKLQVIQDELKNEKEDRQARREFKAKAFRDMDIEFIMKHKGINAQEAAAALEERAYDVEKIVRRWRNPTELGLSRALVHYEKKKNRATIEMW